MGDLVYIRPKWDEYFLKIARDVSTRATCHRRRFGAVITINNKIKGTGYNGAASGLEDCLERGYCIRQQLGIASGTHYETCRSVHAEVNAILNVGIENAEGGVLYLVGEKGDNGHDLIDGVPCSMCARTVLNAHLSRFVAWMADGSVKEYAKNELKIIADKFDVPKTP